MGQILLRNASQSPRAIKMIADVVRKGQTFLKADANLILVCGKRPDQKCPGARDRILDYARTRLNKFQFFIAEHIFELFRDRGDLDLLSLEERLLDFCDCIMIVLESESAYAELGAFAIKDDLAKNMLVVNDVCFRESTSFISLGPLAKINKNSRFGPVIHADLRSVLRNMPELSRRLAAIERHNNRRIDIADGARFSSISAKIRMLFILDIVTFFHPVTLKEIVRILSEYYPDTKFNIGIELHVLQALGLVQTISEHYVRPLDDHRLFFGYYGLKEALVRFDIVNHYHKYAKEKVEILRNRIAG